MSRFVPRITYGLVARGPFAVGIVAIGGIAVGIVAIGAVSVGVVAIGGISLGGLAIGGLAAGYRTVGAVTLGLADSIGGLSGLRAGLVACLPASFRRRPRPSATFLP